MLSKLHVSPTLPFDGLKRAKPFYEKKLGLKLVSGSVKDGYLEYAAGGGTTIQLFESNSEKSEDTAATFEVQDLAKEMTALRKKGVVFEEYNLPHVKTVNGVAKMGEHVGAWIKDPGGNILALHQSAASRARKSAVTAGPR
jgi:catechol 2,3-dioxygenase-like lactoylglutathione lyase family enzyme